jgi:hypothetical protein
MAFPYPQYPQYPPPPRKPFSTADLVLTPLLGVGLLLGCAASFVYSGFAVMATDGCGGTPERCDFTLINTAYVVAWGGIALALLVALVGIIISAVKRKPMFIWPAIGLVILVAAMVVGGVLLGKGVSTL